MFCGENISVVVRVVLKMSMIAYLDVRWVSPSSWPFAVRVKESVAILDDPELITNHVAEGGAQNSAWKSLLRQTSWVQINVVWTLVDLNNKDRVQFRSTANELAVLGGVMTEF